MSAGMLVQCSICESQVRNLTESPVRALQGNALVGVAEYKVRTSTFTQSSAGEDDTPFLAPYPGSPFPYDTPFDYLHESQAISGVAANYPTSTFSSALATLLASGFNWSSPETAVTEGGWNFSWGGGLHTYGYQCCNFWIWGGGGGTMGISLAKNTTGVTQPYFIAQWRTGFGPSQYGACQSGTQFQVIADGTWTIWTCEILSAGFIPAGEVIGYGQTINLPFPGSIPTNENDLGGIMQNADIIFAIIGMDPAAYFNLLDGGALLYQGSQTVTFSGPASQPC